MCIAARNAWCAGEMASVASMIAQRWALLGVPHVPTLLLLHKQG
jgi:hypothetical protein